MIELGPSTSELTSSEDNDLPLTKKCALLARNVAKYFIRLSNDNLNDRILPNPLPYTPLAKLLNQSFNDSDTSISPPFNNTWYQFKSSWSISPSLSMSPISPIEKSSLVEGNNSPSIDISPG